MLIERGRIKLSQYVYFKYAGVDAVTDGNIHQAVFSTQWNGRLGPVLGQRIQTGTRATPEDDGQCPGLGFF